MSNILDDLRLIRQQPSPQERLAKAVAETQETIEWEGQAAHQSQSIAFILSIGTLLIGMSISMALNLETGMSLSMIIQAFVIPFIVFIVLLVAYFRQKKHHALYFGISAQSIWVISPSTVKRHALEQIQKFELFSGNKGHGTISGFRMNKQTFENIARDQLDRQTIVELTNVPEAYDLYQKILAWHRTALENSNA